MKKKITVTMPALLKERNVVLKKIADYKKKVNKPFQKLAVKYVKEHCPVQVGKVYELVQNGHRRRGYTRFVVYGRDIQFLDFSGGRGTVMIRAGGWWLDADNNPAKFADMTVSGVGNPAILKLSENQVANPVPAHLKGRGR